MCLAIPVKIIKIEGSVATVAYRNETMTARMVTGKFSVGDYVIVQAGMVIEKVPKKQAIAWNTFLKTESL